MRFDVLMVISCKMSFWIVALCSMYVYMYIYIHELAFKKSSEKVEELYISNLILQKNSLCSPYHIKTLYTDKNCDNTPHTQLQIYFSTQIDRESQNYTSRIFS
jgi:hypothetical protein